MARTTPFPYAEHLPKPDAAPMAQTEFIENVEILIAEYELALGDSDKSGEVETLDFNEGKLEGIGHALCLLLGVSPEVVHEFYQR